MGPQGEISIPLPARPAIIDAAPTALLEPFAEQPPSMHRAVAGRWAAHAAWVLPSLAMGGIGSIGITGTGLWADELATWGMTTVSQTELWRQLGGTDAAVGTYYLILRVWTALFGDSDLSLRLPSLLAMVGAAAVIARIGTRMLSPRAGLVAGLIFAIIPSTTRFAQEARPYALAVLMAAVATLLLLRALERQTFMVGLGYALSIAFLGALHSIALLLVVAHGIAVALSRPRLLWRWTPTALLGVVLILPLLLVGMRQTGQIDWIKLTDLDVLGQYVNHFFGSAILGGAMLFVGMAGIAGRKRNLVAATVAIVPTVLLLWLGSIAPLWQERYVLFTLVGWALLAGLVLAERGVVAAIAAVSVLAALSIPGHIEVREPKARYQDTTAAAALIERYAQPNDGIVYGLQDKGPGVLNRDILAHYVPPDRRPKDLLVDRPMRTDGWMVASEHPDVAARIASTHRIWVLRLGDYQDPLDGLDGTKSQALRQRFQVKTVWRPVGYTVALLERTSLK